MVSASSVWVAKEKLGTLLLASEMPVPIPRSRTVANVVHINTGMPRVARTVPRATLDAARQDWAYEGPPFSASLGISSTGHVMTTTDGQHVRWTPTHL